MNRDTLERIAGALFLVAFIAAQLMIGITAAVRVLGVACVATGIVWSLGRSIPVGIEGRAPSFFLQGLGALIVGVAMVALGVGFLLYAAQAACLLGWANEKACM